MLRLYTKLTVNSTRVSKVFMLQSYLEVSCYQKHSHVADYIRGPGTEALAAEAFPSCLAKPWLAAVLSARRFSQQTPAGDVP